MRILQAHDDLLKHSIELAVIYGVLSGDICVCMRSLLFHHHHFLLVAPIVLILIRTLNAHPTSPWSPLETLHGASGNFWRSQWWFVCVHAESTFSPSPLVRSSNCSAYLDQYTQCASDKPMMFSWNIPWSYLLFLAISVVICVCVCGVYFFTITTCP